jgi:large subunit ribosomal protein L28
MSKVCQVTGKRPKAGNNVSYSQRKTKRRFEPNLQKRKYWVANEKGWVRLQLSAKAIKLINKVGIEKVLAKMRREGKKVNVVKADVEKMAA